MSLEFIGLIGPQEGSESQASSGADIDLDFIKAIASAQEYGGFDRVLLAVDSRAADSMILASYISAHTEQLGLLVAHRPGFQAPTFAARQFATLDQLSRGRASINVITGGDNGDLQRDGDFTDKDARYGRTEEYLQILKQTWTAICPFDHQGPHYHIKNNLTLIKPLQKPHIPIYFSGASDAAVEVAARHADVYMMWGEPLENIRERIAKVRKAAARYGRENHIRFSVSLRPILGATEEAAWARADRILQQAQALHEQRQGAHGQVDTGKSNSGAERMMNIVSQKNVHDQRLWTAITSLTGSAGNTTALVGTADQVADAVMEYYKLGVTTFLFRGFDQLLDAVAYGQDLLPRVRLRVAQQPPHADH